MENLFIRWIRRKIVLFIIVAMQILEHFIFPLYKTQLQAFLNTDGIFYIIPITAILFFIHYFYFRKEYGNNLKTLPTTLRFFIGIRWFTFVFEYISVAVFFMVIFPISFGYETEQLHNAIYEELAYAYLLVQPYDFVLFWGIDKKLKKSNIKIDKPNRNRLREQIVKTLSRKGNILAIIFVILTAILATWTAENQQTIFRPIETENIFDPMCIGHQSVSFDYNQICRQSPAVYYLGLTGNIDDKYQGQYVNHVRVLFLKINMSEIPSSNLFSITTISSANIILKTRYDMAINNSTNSTSFILATKTCYNTNWSSDTNDSALPCIDDLKYPIGQAGTFDAISPKGIDNEIIDVKFQVDKARENNANIFTELIRIFPSIILTSSSDFNPDTRNCIIQANQSRLVLSNLQTCLKKDQLVVYGPQYSDEGARPSIKISYATEPTSLTKSLIAAATAGIPIVSGILQLWYRDNETRILRMQSACRTLEQEIDDVKDGLTNSKFPQVNQVTIPDRWGSPEINFSLSKTVSLVFLSTDAYDGLISSGSFENFESKDQTDISTLYNHIHKYNETLDYIQKFENDVIQQFHSRDYLRKKWAIVRLLTFYYGYLGDIRENILSSVDIVKGIIEKESTQFS